MWAAGNALFQGDSERTVSDVRSGKYQFIETIGYIEQARALDQDKDKELAKQLTTLAKQLITTAADAGNVVAVRNLGILYRDGDRHGVFEGGSEKARKYFHQAAEQGDTKAQIALGEMYRKGEGVQKDLELAMEWFKRADDQDKPDDQDSVEARINIAEVLYCMRKPIWYGHVREGRDAAEKECKHVLKYADVNDKGGLLARRARYCLARIQQDIFASDVDAFYYEHEFVRREYYAEDEMAIEKLRNTRMEKLRKTKGQFLQNYEKAAGLGHDGARYKLGTVHLRGEKVDRTRWRNFTAYGTVIVPQDVSKATRWFRGVANSNNRLAETLDNGGEHADFRTRVRIELAKLYVENRLSDEEDIRAVLKWLPGVIKRKEWLSEVIKRKEGETKEIQRIRLDALYVLGASYRSGISYRGRNLVGKDDAEARKHFSAAAREGHVGAQNGLGLMYRDGYRDVLNQKVQDVQDFNEAMWWFKKAAGKKSEEKSEEKSEWNWVTGAARNNLGDMYDQGLGGQPSDSEPGLGVGTEFVIEDYVEFGGFRHYTDDKVVEWITPDPGNEFHLGTVYRNGGEGSKRDKNKALKCFQNAALVAPFEGPFQHPHPPEGLSKSDFVTGIVPPFCEEDELVEWHYFQEYVDTHASENIEVERAEDAWPIAEYYIGVMCEETRGKRKTGREKPENWYLLAALRHGGGKPGYPGAQYKLGRMRELEGKRGDAEKWYKAAAVQRDGGPGHPRAQYRLGCMYEKGWGGGEKDLDKAEEWYLKAAEPRWYDKQGCSDAQYRLGCMYERGWGGRNPNLGEAVCWYCKAAEQRRSNDRGHPGAQYRLGCMYEKGWGGGEKDLDEAEKWYLKAAERRDGGRWSGDADAQYRLGCMYENGWGGGEKDLDKAEKWYLKAAERRDVGRWAGGHADAQYRLGCMYENGWGGGEKDLDKAEKWYLKAAERRDVGRWAGGHADAQYRLGCIYDKECDGREPDSGRAKGFYLDAANGDQIEALRWAVEREDADSRYECRLGVKYETGWDGQEPDFDEAEKWYLKAAGKENAEAQYRLGCMYEEGRNGREPNPKKAEKWYRKAADKGNAEAQYRVGRLDMDRAGDDWDKQQVSGEWFRKAAESRGGSSPGHAGAQYMLAKLEERDRKPPRLIKPGGPEPWRCYRWEHDVEWYKQAAAQGYAKAEYELGASYEEGWICKYSDMPQVKEKQKEKQKEWCEDWLKRTRNPDEAEKWYRKAACKGNTNAQYSLARLYEKWWPNLDEALKWYRKAAKQKDGRAALELGRLYWLGWDDRKPNCEKAMIWYKKAARCHWDAGTRGSIQYQIGVMCEKGCKWHPKDREKAKKRYRSKDIAYSKDKHNALYRLGRLYEAEGDKESTDSNKAELYEEAEKLYKQAEKSHEEPSLHPGVEYRLGRMYEKRGRREGSKPDIEEAIKRYSSVVKYGQRDQGYVRYAHYRLGCVYERLGCEAALAGDGQESNSGDNANGCYRKAEKHYRKAAELPEDDTRRRDTDSKRNAAHNSPLASWVDLQVRKEDDHRLCGARNKALDALRRMYDNCSYKDRLGVGKHGFDAVEVEMMARAAEQGNETAMDWLDEKWSKRKKGGGGSQRWSRLNTSRHG